MRCGDNLDGFEYGIHKQGHVKMQMHTACHKLLFTMLCCRRRPDRAALAAGETSQAGSEKYRLEEMQRAEKRERDSKGDKWTPRWFDAVENPALMTGELPLEKVPFWQFNGKYLLEAERPTGATNEMVDGKEFCPWQYPSIHEKL